MGVTSAAIVSLLIAVSAMAGPGSSHALEPTIVGGVLQDFRVGTPFNAARAARSGFEMADVTRDGDAGTHDVVMRYERADHDSLCFVEIGGRDLVVRAVGWTRILSRVEADSLARGLLARHIAVLGFPDDLVAEGDVHALAWTDGQHALRFEVLSERADESGESWDLTVVVRRDTP
jgi:hypothetical protein